ncbi:gp53-like domain-containing protein [Serratia marcescens]
MHRIDTPTAQIDKFGPGKNGFTNGDPATGRRATDLNSDMWDAVQEEMANAIEGNGIKLDKSKHNQLYLAIQKAITDPGFLKKANNLSDLANVAEARGNLQLGTAATKNVGTEGGNVMAVGAFGLGAGPQHKADAFSDLAQIYRINASSASTPGGSVYGVMCLPCDGAPSAAYLAAGNNGELHVGRSTTASQGVLWNRVYTTAYKPTAADVNAYTKQEADGRFVYKSGDTIAALNVNKGLYVGEDTTVNRNLFVGGSGFVEKRGVGDVINNVRNTNGYRIFGAGDLFADIYHNERVRQNHFLGIHVANGGADGWFEFRNDGQFIAGSIVIAGGGNGSKLHPDGNVQGSIWGGYLRDWLNNQINSVKNTANFSGNGWWRCSSTGMIVQWGTVDQGNDVPVTFPIAFPNNCLSVQMTQSGSQWGSQSSSNISATGRSRTGFISHIYSKEISADWIAVGF